MKITLHNFMKYEDLTITINLGEITLISGKSEAGKSSIFDAICWCLYGRVQKVARGDHGKVFVKMEFPDMTIYRQARPGNIRITCKDKTILRGKAAQNMINRRFHNKDVWKSCSLIEQKKECFLLESSYKDRRRILFDLTFDEDDPNIYIKKIEDYQVKIKAEYATAMTEYNVLNRQYKKINNKDSKTPATDLDKHKKQLISDKKEKLELETILKELTKSKKKQDDLEILLKNLNKQKENNLKAIIILGTFNIDLEKLKLDLECLKNDFKTNTTLVQRIDKYNKIKAKLDILPTNNLDPSYITEKYYYETKNREISYTNNTKLAKKHSVNYQEEDIKVRIKEINKNIDEHNKLFPFLNIITELEILEKISNFEIQEVSPEEINKERDKHQAMKKERELLKCPWCSKTVYYKNSNLIKSDKAIVTELELKEQFLKVKKLVLAYQKKIEYDKTTNRIVELTKKLGSYANNREIIKNHKPVAVRKSYSIINELEQIKIITPSKHTSLVIRNAITRKELTDVIDSEYHNIDLNKKNIKITIKDINTATKNYQVSVKKEEKRKILNIAASLLNNQISDIKIDHSIKLKHKEINTNLDNIINDINTTIEYITDQEQLIDIYDALSQTKKLFSKLNTIQSLKERAINLSCDLLNDTVNQINESSIPILKHMFEKSVTIELNLFKELKGKKIKGNAVMKQMVNLDVYFDAKKHDKRMCGGEKDRISIALLIALNNYSHSPFLLMDELLGTVSSETAERCIKQIKKYTKNKYVICIEHKAVYGRYDRVIKF